MEEFLKDSPSDFNATIGTNNNGNKNTNNNRLGINYGNVGEQQLDIGENDNNFPIDDAYLSSNYNGNNVDVNANNTVNPNYFTSDPFLEDLESINFPNQQPQAPQFINPSNTSNLEEVISPHNNYENGNSFINPQYFSPPNKGPANFNNLDSIAENSLSSSFNTNTFSPTMSRHDSISGPANIAYNSNNPDINSGSYLSPQANPQFLSPKQNAFDRSLDTLKMSPYNANTYLNSPPAFPLAGVLQENQHSTSIPNNTMLSSPRATPSLSTSVPNSQLSQPRDLSTRQLSKEEKLKRRREFHNAVERRRRDLIKERIKELGLLVPPSLLNPQLCAVQSLQRNSQNSREIMYLLSSVKVKETKPNKSTILNKSVDYLHHLKYVLEEQEKTRSDLEQKLKECEDELDNSLSDNIPKPNDQIQFEQDDVFNPDEFFLDVIGR
ncbi:uncharacterized protein PRCAT00000700001 [Priceomyces carsonii]|uniref:uncharacterized protein n=1 Tax=Priceomyces carsonii TaxID=28549 RepID=UPI002ED9BE34|nr:unnamed protein product [Priceomyces carsonii]